MKRFLSIIALLLVLVMTVTSFAACGDDSKDESSADASVDESVADSENVTVTWYYGSEVLKEEQVAKGTTLTSWTPEVADKSFTGWFAEASCSTAFDFAVAVEADTDIFAAFRSEVYVEDTTEYYLIGTGSGSMKVSGWDHTASAENLKMTKDTSITDKNVYTIEIEMFAGDRFQICHDGSWDGQFGIGGFAGCEYAAGINPNKPAEGEVTAEDQKYAEVKNADGEVVFIGGDENNNTSVSWNAILNEGHDGKYKITLITYPNSIAYNEIQFELIEKIEPMTQTHEMYIYGTVNEWANDDKTFALAESEDKTTWSGFITITEDHYADWTATDENNASGEVCAAIKLINHISGSDYGVDGGMANIFLPAGTYAVKYTVADNSIAVQACDYYVVGTLLDAEGNAVNFAVKEGVSPKLEVVDGVATGKLEVYDATGLADYNWMVAQSKPGVMAVKVVFGSELGIKDWYADPATEGDNFYLPLGTYNVSLDIATGTASVVAE